MFVVGSTPCSQPGSNAGDGAGVFTASPAFNGDVMFAIGSTVPEGAPDELLGIAMHLSSHLGAGAAKQRGQRWFSIANRFAFIFCRSLTQKVLSTQPAQVQYLPVL